MSVMTNNRAIQISLNETFNIAKCASTMHLFFFCFCVHHKYRRKKIEQIQEIAKSKMLVKLNIVGISHKVLFSNSVRFYKMFIFTMKVKLILHWFLKFCQGAHFPSQKILTSQGCQTDLWYSSKWPSNFHVNCRVNTPVEHKSVSMKKDGQL